VKLLEKLGSAGALVAAAACPICFPKLALIGAFFGLGGLAAYEAELLVAMQALVLLTSAAHVIAFRRSRNGVRLALALSGALLVFAALYFIGSELLVYAGLALLVAASFAGPLSSARRRSVLACPQCGHRRSEIMPVDACQFFYECRGCGALLRAKAGDCCVFCSYGSVPCPPKQRTASASHHIVTP
jgi:MerC mercury resistance protein